MFSKTTFQAGLKMLIFDWISHFITEGRKYSTWKDCSIPNLQTKELHTHPDNTLYTNELTGEEVTKSRL